MPFDPQTPTFAPPLACVFRVHDCRAPGPRFPDFHPWKSTPLPLSRKLCPVYLVTGPQASICRGIFPKLLVGVNTLGPVSLDFGPHPPLQTEIPSRRPSFQTLCYLSLPNTKENECCRTSLDGLPLPDFHARIVVPDGEVCASFQCRRPEPSKTK